VVVELFGAVCLEITRRRKPEVINRFFAVIAWPDGLISMIVEAAGQQRSFTLRRAGGTPDQLR
jgi:hypothetical protein